jgi:hypothetical protein
LCKTIYIIAEKLKSCIFNHSLIIMTTKHKTFISYHHANDEAYKKEFKKIFSDIHDILVPWDVEIGDIDPNLKTDTIRRKIRDEYLRDSTVTVVLIGSQTWQRKHVDWEIYSSLRDTQSNPRSGLIGILLPTHPDYKNNQINSKTIPPRFHDNWMNGFAKLYRWSISPIEIEKWVHEAFENRSKTSPLPNLQRELFKNNRTGNQWQ